MNVANDFGVLGSSYADELLRNYKLTPATLAFMLENLDVTPNQRLRWFPAPHLMYISLKIAQGIARGNARIIVSAPPRHGKSKLCTHYGPLWVLENFDNYNVALITYGADLSQDFAREVRDSINWYGAEGVKQQGLLEITVREDASRLSNFHTTRGGQMISIGIGGPFTGRGAHVIFIDDYIKTIKEALSETYREQQWEWLISTAMTRLEPDASVIIIATRWHEDDMIGRILRYKDIMGDWEYIRLPAIAEQEGTDPLGRMEGEPLFPFRFSLKSILERKAFMGSAFFDAIYQQNPHTETDKYADRSWLNYVDSLPLGRMKLVRVWDMASTPGGGDWTVGSLMGHHEPTKHTYLLNIARKQKSPANVERLIRETAELDTHNTEVILLRDPGSAGQTVVDHYKRNVLQGFTVDDIYTNKNKLINAQPYLAACEAGRISLLRAHWNETYAKEFERFPNGEHDDQIDTTATGYKRLIVNKKLGASWGRKTQQTIGSGGIQRATAEEQARILANQEIISERSGAKSILPSSAFRSVRRATFGRQ